MRKRRIAIPRLESMEDRIVLSHYASQFLSSASAELHKLHTSLINKSLLANFHKLHTNLNSTLHKIQHGLSSQNTSHTNHATTHQNSNDFWNSLKSLFKF
jgi:hypothetical protein